MEKQSKVDTHCHQVQSTEIRKVLAKNYTNGQLKMLAHGYKIPVSLAVPKKEMIDRLMGNERSLSDLVICSSLDSNLWPVRKSFWPNGQLRYELLKNGKYKEFSSKGTIVKVGQYVNGEELSIKESHIFWNLYMLTVQHPQFIPKLLEKIPKEKTLIYTPLTFNIFEVEMALQNEGISRYLPIGNQKVFEPIIKNIKKLYYRPFPHKSLL